jgi:predicted dehydrogenase
MHVSANSPVHRREIRLLCENGVAMFSDADSACLRVIHNEGGREERLPVSDEMPLLRELRAFVHHLQGGPPPRSSAPDAAAIVATLAALRRLAGIDPGSA